jgi:hypothetical protein
VRKSTIYLYLLGIAVVIMTALVGGGLVSAQNSNSSSTEMSNTNTRPKKSGRHKAKPKTTEPAADTGMAAEAMPPATPRRTGRCDPMQQEQTDLSGTYTGKLRHGDDVRDATLTITGNNFTMTSGSDTHSGRITAVTTCGYTAVTVMHVGDMAAAAPGATPPPPNKVMSLRAKKMGDSLTLTSVPGEPERVMFTSGGGAMRPRKHRTRKAAPPPPPTTPPEQ